MGGGDIVAYFCLLNDKISRLEITNERLTFNEVLIVINSTKTIPAPFFAKVSVVEYNLLFYNLIATDTQYRWGVGHNRVHEIFSFDACNL